MTKSQLPKAIPIREQIWPEGTIPLVTIRCITYNHADFIRNALDGFLMQETDFPVEILIHDDASTDDTAAIVQKYIERYPGLIKAIFQSENQAAKGPVGRDFARTCMSEMTKGRYIAFCEGDDFWCDPQKLQLQLDVLCNSQNVVGCCHDIDLIGSDGLEPAPQDWFVDWGDRSRLTLEDVISYRAPFHTSSFLVRTSVVVGFDQQLIGKSISGDLVLFVLAASRGDICRINRVMSVYRSHPGGITKSAPHRDRIYFLLNRIRMWRSLKHICIHAEGSRLAMERLHIKMLVIELLKNVRRGNLGALVRLVRHARSLDFF